MTDDGDTITLRIPADLKRKLKRKAKAEDLTISQIARRAIRRDLEAKAKARR